MKISWIAAAWAMAWSATAAEPAAFEPLFDGATLNGWTAVENPDSFSVQDGCIVAFGPRAHLFYTGPVNGAAWKNFHFKCEVKTFPKANSGIFIHTAFQEKGWPAQGYEVQINNSHKDPQRTAGLYAVAKVDVAPAKDAEWFVCEIIVRGKRVVTKINGKTMVEFTEPDSPEGPPTRRLSRGMFALQAHDPESRVMYRNIAVQTLPEN